MYQFINKWKKPLLLFVGVALYMSVLCLISLYRSPAPLENTGGSGISPADFAVTVGEGGTQVKGDALLFTSSGGLQVFSAPISLTDSDAVSVSFTVNCAESSAGKILHVDLCGDGYDREECEFTYSLQSGENTVSGQLLYGDGHPSSCNLRIFSTDAPDAAITNPVISQMAYAQRNAAGCIAAMLILAGCELLLVLLTRKKKVLQQGGSVTSSKSRKLEKVEQPAGQDEIVAKPLAQNRFSRIIQKHDGWCVILSYCVILALLYLKYFLAGQVPFSGDGILTYAEPLLPIMSLGSGELAVWNKFLSAGTPLLASYTPVMLLGFLPYQVLAYVLYIGFIAVGATFAYQYFKKIGCSRLAAFCVSLCYLLSVHVGGMRKSHCLLIYTVALLPVILYLVEEYFHTQKLRWLLASAAVMALQFMVGFSQQCIYTDLFVGFYLIAFGLHRRMSWKKMLSSGLLWAGSYFGLICWKVLAIAQESSFYSALGAEGVSYDKFTSYSIHPIKLLEMVFPKFFGGDVYMAYGYTKSSEMDIELFLGCFFALLLFFTIIALWRNFRVRFALCAMVVTFAYAAQAHIPYLSKIIYHIPVLNGFRVPSRILFLFVFCAFTLAALGLSALQDLNLWGKMRKLFAAGAMLCAVCCCAAMIIFAFVFHADWIASFASYFQANLLKDMLFLTGCILCVSLLFHYRAQMRRLAYPALCFAVVGFTLAQTLPYAAMTAPSSASDLYATDPVSERLQAQIGDSKLWDAFEGIDGAHDSLISLNRGITKEIPTLNTYIAMNNPVLYRMMSGEASAPLNYSGLMTGSLSADQNLHLQNALLSMLGIEYIIDSSGLVAADNGISNIISTEGKIVAHTQSITVPYSGGDFSVVSFPMEIQPQTCYLIEFDCIANADISFYVDFYGGDTYDFSGQQLSFSAGTEETHCSGVISSGDPTLANSELCWRIITQGAANLSVENFSIAELSVQRTENVYQLWDEGEGTPIYRNTRARQILYVPDEIAYLADPEKLISDNLLYQVDRINYSDELSPRKLYSADTIIADVEFAYNEITATVNTQEDTFVNFSQCYYPGWKAYVDGKETSLYTVNELIMGMEVPAGEHTIRFAYQPMLLYVGVGVSAFSALALAIAGIIQCSRKHKKVTE